MTSDPYPSGEDWKARYELERDAAALALAEAVRQVREAEAVVGQQETLVAALREQLSAQREALRPVLRQLPDKSRWEAGGQYSIWLSNDDFARLVALDAEGVSEP